MLLANTDEFGAALTFGGKNLFDWVDFLTASVMLPLGGLLMALFVGFVMPRTQIRAGLKNSMSETGFALWYLSLRYIVPPALIIVMLNMLGMLSFELIMPMFIVAYLITGIIAYGHHLNRAKS
jgi:neurotransmitter:Na+ symporter, NSS family